jgi:cytochrome c556
MAYGDQGEVRTLRLLGGRMLKAALAAALPLVPLSTVHGQAEDPVLHRQLIMQQLDDEAEVLGSIAARITPPTKMAEHARTVAKAAKESYEAFKQNAPGGAAKPEIWTNWADYSKRMEAFVANSEKMAKVAESGDVNAVTELLVDALPCKGCHDVYREKKKPAAS